MNGLSGIAQQAQGMGQGIMPPHPMTPPVGNPTASQPQGNSQLPPPQILIQLAQEAKALDPLHLGALIFHALQQEHQPMNQQGITALSQ